MTYALAAAHAAKAQPFNADFYMIAATVIPVLFVAIAVEGRLIRDLVGTTVWSLADGVALLMAVMIGHAERQAAQDNGDAGSSWSGRLSLGVAQSTGLQLVAGFTGMLAITIILLGTASEITAFAALYGGASVPWMDRLTITGTILLICAVGVIPVAAMIRVAREDVKAMATLITERLAARAGRPGAGQPPARPGLSAGSDETDAS